MDYTTLANVKTSLGSTATASDALLSRYIAAASRAIDRHCAGFQASENYFELGNVTDEQGMGNVDFNGSVFYMANKAAVNSVSSFSYRSSPLESWMDVDADLLAINGYTITAWIELGTRGRRQVKTSYSGGLAATIAAMPADIIEAATIMTIRLYDENKSGQGDVIGISELGQVFYSKAMPQRVVLLLKPYTRAV